MLLPILLAALAPASYQAFLSPNGEVRIVSGTDLVASLSFGAAEQGWAWASTQMDPDGLPPLTTRFRWSGGEGVVVTDVREVAGGLEVTVNATPEATGTFESCHMGLAVPASRWKGGSVSLDGELVGLPETFGVRHLANLSAQRVVLDQGGRLALEMDSPGTVLVQDSREWGDTFDIRLGITSGTWQAGQTKSYTVRLTMDEPIALAPPGPYMIQEGADWVAFDQMLDVEPGSALDWSPKETVPAGSRGWIVAQGDRFVYEGSTEPLRFYGANICFSAAVPDKPTADKLAERLWRLGYNTVRFHHYDVEITGGFEGTGPSTELAADPMDRLDYLFAKLKERGIYLTIDLFTIRQVTRDQFMDWPINMDEFKALLLVDDRARANWLAYTRNLLEHVNPYTGLKWKDDPALAWICVVNENNIGSASRSLSPQSRALFDAKWQAAGNEGTWTYETDEGARFGAELHAETYRWMRDRMREMGVRALLTDNNGWHEQTALILNREQLDFVDNHNYWDHPHFLGDSWGLPSRGSSGGGPATAATGGGLKNIALTRLAGKPFSVSEFNFCNPNPYRAEGGLFIGALAARQDWDILWRFAWSHSVENVRGPQPTNYFDVQACPIMLASERAAIALFLRRDLAPAQDQVTLRIDDGGGAASYWTEAANRPFDVRLYSSTTEGSPNPPVPQVAPGPVTVNGSSLTVDSPASRGVFGMAGTKLEAGGLEVEILRTSAAVWATSVDGAPLETSQRILVTHLTDVQNTDMKYASPDRGVLMNWGRLPHLVRDGSAYLALPVAAGMQVYRLDAAGRRVETIPSTYKGGKLTFTVSVRGPEGATLYYEIAP